MQIVTCADSLVPDSKILQLIDQLMEKLERFFKHIVKAQITLKNDPLNAKGKITEIRLVSPNAVYFVRESRQNIESSIVAAVTTLKRQFIRAKDFTTAA